MTLTTFLSGDLMGLYNFIKESPDSIRLSHYIMVYTFVAYIAISFHMSVVRRFGGVSAVLVATGRKGMTLIVSFLLFPKKFSWLYVVGAVMVLGGLMMSSLHKIRNKKKNAANSGREGDERKGLLNSRLAVTTGSAENDSEQGSWTNNTRQHQS